MLALAVILTIVCGALLGTSLTLGGYVLVVKIREFHRNAGTGANANPAESPSTP